MKRVLNCSIILPGTSFPFCHEMFCTSPKQIGDPTPHEAMHACARELRHTPSSMIVKPIKIVIETHYSQLYEVCERPRQLLWCGPTRW